MRSGTILAADARSASPKFRRSRIRKRKEMIMPNLTELSEGETALRAVERDWNAAAQHWNSAGLVALYTEDAVFYGGRPGHAVGHAKVREYFDSYVGTLAAARLAL